MLVASQHKYPRRVGVTNHQLGIQVSHAAFLGGRVSGPPLRGERTGTAGGAVGRPRAILFWITSRRTFPAQICLRR
jgi:hypothetical protein